MKNNDTTFYGYTATCHVRPKWSLGHDLRIPEYVDNQREHIDPNGYHKNILNLGNTEKEIYERIFGESIRNYNKRQSRKDRQIKDYLSKVIEDGRRGTHKNVKADATRKPFYQQLFYIGNQQLHCPNELSEKIMRLFITKVMPKKFPNFISCNTNLHGDEFSIDKKTKKKTPSTWHIHNLGVFVAHALTPEELKQEYEYRDKCKELKKKELADQGIAWDEKKWNERDWRKSMIERWGKSLEKGPELQCSMSAACAEMGFYTRKGLGTAQQQFEEAVREEYMSFCESMGLKIDRRKKRHREHLGREDYIEEQEFDKAKKELDEEQELLRLSRIALENELDDFAYEKEHIDEQRKKVENDRKKVNNDYLLLTEREKKISKQIQNIEKREKNLKEYSEDLAEKETNLTDREHWLKNGENALSDKQKELLTREREVKKQEDKIAIEKSSLSEAQNNIQKAQTQLEKQIFDARKEIAANQKMVREWEEAIAVQTFGIDEKSTDAWIDSEALNLRKSKITFPQFISKIKTGVKGLIGKVKKLYDQKIKQYEQKLNGYDYRNSKTGEKVHSFGCAEMQRMFCTDSTPETFRQIAKDMEDTGVSNYDELYRRKPKILERHFKYAREINRSNEITR